ncbi:peptidyl-alpha-hydroxyglycine alpha-amidating lyase family protein [Flavihumibacter sp. ZG627]|uniref:peptidyl-alpha-hydroxyglycine alpha-amidating lyase family protein n=1 Tax=Flavihumibacter sp. ZG627 TaxID=1463156 RepID=UPI00057FDE01|nr:peptidyl-alpha-hydroxyglycine alpha-amidating lyase family protein [Flavihumibacter sp. ZG627]KIC91066.1 hypothetical protein HY58_08640 [Flavihumibacter sp. ZG627]
MKYVFFLLVLLAVVSCRGKSDTIKDVVGSERFELVENWSEAGDIQLGQPTGIGVGKNDHLFIFHRAGRKWTEPFPDSVISANTIMELDKSGKVVNTWGGNYFIMPHGLTVDKENNIWVTDVGLHQVFKFTKEGRLLMKLGVVKQPGNDSLHFNLPTDIAVADDGYFYVSDGYGNSRVVKFSPTGKYIKSWGRYGTCEGEFNIPHGITIGEKNIIYVADRQNNRVQLFDSSGNFLKELKNDEDVEQLPSLTLDYKGNLYVIDYDPTIMEDSTVKGSTIFMFDSAQKVSTHFGAKGSGGRTSSWFHDIAIDSKGNIYVGDIRASKVLKFRRKDLF